MSGRVVERVVVRLGEREHPIARPSHGLFDAGTVATLAQLATLGDEAAGARLIAVVQRAAEQLWTSQESRPRCESVADAIEVADAICDALEITTAGAATAITFAGVAPAGGCREFLVDDAGAVLRERTETEQRPEACSSGCPAVFCARRSGPSVDIARAIREWRLCGGRRRTCLPRTGGLEDQDAATIFFFSELDDAADAVAADAARRA